MPAGRARGTVVGEELLIVSGKGVGVVGVEADSGAGDSRGEGRAQERPGPQGFSSPRTGTPGPLPSAPLGTPSA